MPDISPALAAVAIYSAVCFFIIFWLGNAIGILRRKHKIAIGTGGNKHIERTMRGQANATENIPLFLIGLLIAALMNAPIMAIHILGIVFCIGRAMHAWHFIQEEAPMRSRFIGFGISALAMTVLFVGLLAHGIWSIIGA